MSLFPLVILQPFVNRKKKAHLCESEEFGTLSQKGVNDILIDKFGAKIRIGHEGKRGLIFNKETLNRLAPNYAKSEKIQIIKNAEC